LGLAISRHIAEMLDGELTATSTWGQGSCFTLVVPTGSLKDVPMIENPAEPLQDAVNHDWRCSPTKLLGVRILLAEDGYDNRELIRTILQGVGAEVEMAENGRLAVERAEAEAFDVILMDINMPELDGYEATRLLRDGGYRGPILALTANAMSGDSERCRAAGCDEHLAKPIDRLRLVRTIAAYVGRNAAVSQNASAAFQDSTDQAEAIVSQYADDPELAVILAEFVGRLDSQFKEMQEAYAHGRMEELQRTAHRLKGAGGSYG
jgi:CheY-like chemotaxis protein